MQVRRGQQWEVREGASRDVLVALYLRDAIGIVDPSGLPRMLGTGLPELDAPLDEFSGWAWTRWWVSVIEPDARIPALPETASSAWERIVRRHLDDARTWAAVAHDDHGIRVAERMMLDDGDLTIGELVAERETELGRPAAAFRLRIEVLPLASSGIWWIAEEAIAVDETLRADLPAYRAALRPIVERLV